MRCRKASRSSIPDALIRPGFVDTHVHYPQLDMIGAFGTQLLGLAGTLHLPGRAEIRRSRRMPPGRRRFPQRAPAPPAQPPPAVYCTVHPAVGRRLLRESPRAQHADDRRQGPDGPQRPAGADRHAERGYADIEGADRALARPRAAALCASRRASRRPHRAQLERPARSGASIPDTYVQTHVAENTREIAWVETCFRERRSYLDVYDHAGLLGPRAVFAHGIHLDEAESAAAMRPAPALSHCPTSNLFLGSGLFDLRRQARRPAGPPRHRHRCRRRHLSFSQLRTLNEAYKVAALSGTKLTALQAFYLSDARRRARRSISTTPSARWSPASRPTSSCSTWRRRRSSSFRLKAARTIEEICSCLMTIGDDRAVRATYVAGSGCMTVRGPSRSAMRKKTEAPAGARLARRGACAVLARKVARAAVAAGVGEPLRRLRPLLPGQAGGGGDGSAPTSPTSPASCSTATAASAPTMRTASATCRTASR